MPLSHRNSGKYLSKKWDRLRAQAVKDKSTFDSDELDWLDITGTEGTGKFQDRTYRIPSLKLTVEGKRRDEAIDIRLLPKMGGTI